MSDAVFINGLVLHAFHGVMPHEGKVGQPFVLDLVLDIDLAAAAKSDKVADTVSYDAVVGVVSRGFTARRYRLLEAAAGAVAGAILESFPRVAKVRVTVRKPHAPVAAVFDDVGVTIARNRRG
ncbi:MAG: dihydroneopterin aldolase [Xanthobacteraceae bacterium]